MSQIQSPPSATETGRSPGYRTETEILTGGYQVFWTIVHGSCSFEVYQRASLDGGGLSRLVLRGTVLESSRLKLHHQSHQVILDGEQEMNQYLSMLKQVHYKALCIQRDLSATP